MSFIRTPSAANASTTTAATPGASNATATATAAPGSSTATIFTTANSPAVTIGASDSCTSHRLTVHRAERWPDRLRGLLGAPPPAPGHALLIVPCASIHTAFMRYPIDVVFLDRRGRIRKVVEGLPPWRATACLGATQTLELAAGQARAMALAPGGCIDPSVLDPTLDPEPEQVR